MLGPPTFSVVIPTYNRARFVLDAVRSVLDQTDRDFELIVVDDGSRDATPDVLRPCLERLRYIRQDNRGMASARNHGIREARGRYVALLDSDDRWEPLLLERVRRAFERHPDAGAVFVAEREIDEAGRLLPGVHTKRTPGDRFTTAGLIGRDTRVGSGRPAVARRSLFDEAGFYDETLEGAWDCDLWIRHSFHTAMYLVPEPLVQRRIHTGGFSRAQDKDARGWLAILDRVEREHPEFAREHRRLMRRVRGKNRLRLGRELLVRSSSEPVLVAESRRQLLRAIGQYPWFPRAWLYLAWSFVAPAGYASWRRSELQRRYPTDR